MPQPDTNQKVIALIEDDKIIAELLVKKLEHEGFVVKIAEDGEAGVTLVEQMRPDLVLLDMKLPRLDGFGVLERLHQQHIVPPTPLVIISNSGQPIEVERALGLGANDYLVKVNFDPEDVVTKIHQIFETKPSVTDGMAPPTPPLVHMHASALAHVLMVEDDLMLVQLLERKLIQQKKYEVHKAFDVPQARAELAEHGADIILLDIVLPGIDGFTFLRELKADDARKHIPVIIMSNLGQQEEIKRGKEGGAIDYIVKAHTNPQDIIERIDSALNK